MIGEEKGFASFYAICVLMILSVLGMAAYITVEKEVKASRHFAAQSLLRMEAQSGIVGAVAYLNGHPAKAAEIRMDRPICIWNLQNAENGIECSVYAIQQGGTVRLLSQSSTKEKQQARMYVKLAAGAHGGYVIRRWER